MKREQLMTLWHVDDVKASHPEDKVILEFVDYLHGVHDDEEIGTTKFTMDHDMILWA